LSQHPWSSDSELVAQILSGSRDAFELFYEAYFPRVYRFALKRLHDTAESEDVAQEVFFTVFNVLDSYEGQAPLIVWVFGITRNTVNRRFRRKRLPIESLDAPEPSRCPAVTRRPTACSTRAGCCACARRRSSTTLPAAAPHLPPEALAATVDPHDRPRARQIRRRDQGQPVSDAHGARAERARLESLIAQ